MNTDFRRDVRRPTQCTPVSASSNVVHMPPSITVGLVIREVRRGFEPEGPEPLFVELKRLARDGDRAAAAVVSWIAFRRRGAGVGKVRQDD